MNAAINDHNLHPWIFGPVILTVKFPEELNEGRKIWAEIHLAETDIEFAATEGDLTGKYSLRASVGEEIVLQASDELSWSWFRIGDGLHGTGLSRAVPGLMSLKVLPKAQASLRRR